jgi:hypothetical protein
MKDEAIAYFSQRRGNCAQAVAHAWKSKNPSSPHAPEQFTACGGGRAPEGVCGALHAGCTVAGEPHAANIRTKFAEKAGGHQTCRAIRAAKAMPCADCVTLAAELLEQHAEKGGGYV